MVAPLLCGTLAGVIPGVGVLTAALLHRLWGLGDQLEPVEEIPAQPLQWQLEPAFMLLGLIILLDVAHRLLFRFKVRETITPSSRKLTRQALGLLCKGLKLGFMC